MPIKTGGMCHTKFYYVYKMDAHAVHAMYAFVALSLSWQMVPGENGRHVFAVL